MSAKASAEGGEAKSADTARPLKAEFLGPASGNSFRRPQPGRWAEPSLSPGPGRPRAAHLGGTPTPSSPPRPPGPAGVSAAATGAMPRISRLRLLPSQGPVLAPPRPAPARTGAPPTSARARVALTAVRAASRAGRSELAARASGGAGPGAGAGGGARPGRGRGPREGAGRLQLPALSSPPAAANRVWAHPAQPGPGPCPRLSTLLILPVPSVPRSIPRVHPDPAHSRDPLVSAQGPRSDLGVPSRPTLGLPLGILPLNVGPLPSRSPPPALPHSRRHPISGIPSPSPPSDNVDHQPPVPDPRFPALRSAALFSPILSSVRSDASRQPEILCVPLGKSPTLSGPQLPACKMGITVPVS